MRKTIFSTFLFILFLMFIGLTYLSFFGYETDRFNEIIKQEVKNNQKNLTLDFDKISILLDIKKLTLFVRFIDPNINYLNVLIPLNKLRTDIDLEPLIEKKLVVKKIILATKILDFDSVKPLIKTEIENINLDIVKSGKFTIKNLELELDKNFEISKNIKFDGVINSANLKILKNFEVKNLLSKFSYDNNNFVIDQASWNLNNLSNSEKEFFDCKIKLKKIKNSFDINLNLKTKKISNFLKIPGMNYDFENDLVANINSKFLIRINKNTSFQNISIKDENNFFKIKNLIVDKNFNLINFEEINIKTFLDDNVNNELKITNKDKILITGKVFDAEMLIKELSKDKKNNEFLKKISGDIEIDLKRILKGTKFPIKNFRLIGNINKGNFEKISAKSDFSNDEHLDISLKKQEINNEKILEVYSDIATPLLSDYKFFQGLEGGNLLYVSSFDKKKSYNELTINDFKLNNAPALAKILTLADLKGLTDTLKGEGISFETLSIKYESDSSTMNINEIFMIGPSISILIDGYIEKKSGLVSLRGTLVPAKTLNTLVSKIPVVGDILVGKKVGEGVFGLSFKIKGLPNNLKTTVNPVKSLAPRFITRAVEAAKKRGSK